MAYLLREVPKGGRAHYAQASALLSFAMNREIVVAQRPSGRPRLAGAEPELGVSLSWRDGSLLVGYSPTANVGVDLEPDDATLDAIQLAQDHFSSGEAEAISNAADPRDLFLRLWVAKEAILKATGRGVYDGLDEPDLARCIVFLRGETPFEIPASSRAPAGSAVVKRIVCGEPALFVALSRLDVV
ncbi:MAG: 4'-phosphopantetheinyl transferase superfamily protein [Microvirga sp.]